MAKKKKAPKEKYIVTTVTTPGREDSGFLLGPLLAVVPLRKEIAEDVVRMHGLLMEVKAKDSDIYTLSCWDSRATFMSGVSNEDDLDYLEGLENCESDYEVTEVRPLPGDVVRTDADRMIVHDDGVVYESNEHYAGFPMETQRIPLSAFTDFLEGLK